MSSLYRLAILSYTSQINSMLYEFQGRDEYSIEYIPMSYSKPGLGAVELLEKNFDVCLVYSSYAFKAIELIGSKAVNINKTDIDRIRALRMARKISVDIGIPFYKKDNIDCALLEELCNVKLHPLLYDNLEELGIGLRKLTESGVKVFIGGGSVASFCKQYQMHYIPILPSRSSIAEAIEQALNIARLSRIEKTKHEQLVNILKMFNEGVIYVNSEGKTSYYNAFALNLLNIMPDRREADLTREVDQKVRRFSERLFIKEVLESGVARVDQVVSLFNRELMVNTMPMLGHDSSMGVTVFLRDVKTVHDMAGRVRDIQRKKGGFIARFTVDNLKGISADMVNLRKYIRLYAPHDAPVLIHGETGTGKDLVAQSIHNASSRRSAPFVAINCAALPESLLESELFGYEEGAFTGARKGGKPGLLEMAHTGTLFLDEIAELSHSTQLRLLRVLENKEIIRVGGSSIIPVDIRIISASHKSLPELVGKGQFRADLFYRLAVLRLKIPPLRHRTCDIPCLLEELLSQYGRDPSCLTPGILEAMSLYHWPGNIRELRAVMESYLIMLGNSPSDEAMFLSMLSSWTKDGMSIQRDRIISDAMNGDLKTILEETKRNIVMETVARCGFSKKKAAQQLGISYNTLWRILGNTEDSVESTRLADPKAIPLEAIDPAS